MIALKMKDKKWVIEVKDEAWSFDTLEEMKSELEHLLNMKDTFGRFVKNEY